MKDPVYHWYDRWRGRCLSCRQTFLLITLLFLIPSAFLGYQLWQETSHATHTLQVASSSLLQHRQLSTLLQEIIEHEQLMQRSLLGDPSLQTAINNLSKRIDQEINPLKGWAQSLSEEEEKKDFSFTPMLPHIQTILRSWKILSQSRQLLTQDINLAEHLKIVEAIRSALGIMQERLALDGEGDLVVRLLSRLLYLQIPALQQEMMHLATLGEKIAYTDDTTLEMRRPVIETMALVQQQSESIQSLGRQVMHLEQMLNNNLRIQVVLESPLASLHESIDRWLRQIRASDEHITPLKLGPFIIIATEALGESSQLTRTVMEELQRLLNQRSADLNETVKWRIIYFALILLAILASAFYLFHRILKGFEQVQQSAQEMEQGNFSVPFPLHLPKELASLSAIFNRIGSSIQALLYSLQTIKDSLFHSTTAIQTLSGEYDQALLQQETSNHQMNLQTKELTYGAKQALEHAQDTLIETEKIVNSLKESKELLHKFSRPLHTLVSKAQELVHELAVMNSQSESATELINAMTQVADRTNLLSLNTAIEAEKMGSTDSGFGIIADEVRRLADQTAHSTLNMEQAIQQLAASVGLRIEDMQQLVQGLESTDQRVQQFDLLFTSIQDQLQQEVLKLEKIKQAVMIQQTVAQTITQAIQPLHQQTETTIRTMEKLQTEFRHLSKAADGLKSALGE